MKVAKFHLINYFCWGCFLHNDETVISFLRCHFNGVQHLCQLIPWTKIIADIAHSFAFRKEYSLAPSIVWQLQNPHKRCYYQCHEKHPLKHYDAQSYIPFVHQTHFVPGRYFSQSLCQSQNNDLILLT